MQINSYFFIAIRIVFSIGVLPFLQGTLFAQNEGNKITTKADWGYYDEELLPGILKLTGNVVFTQGEIIGYCDSAYFHEKNNNIEAFGKVVKIYINDSVTLKGEYVFYNGNERMASISKNVILEDNASVLETDSLIYDLNTDVGYYLTGGTTRNEDNTLVSKKGLYYTSDNKIIVKDSVFLYSDSYTMDCDSLAFNTQTEIAYFISRTRLISEENTIYTSGGWYDTKLDIALLKENVEIINGTQEVYGDSVFYEKEKGFAIGWSNVTIRDSVKDYIAKGDYAEYYENGGISTITDRAMLILIDHTDSLFVHADTFKIHIDTLQEPQMIRGYNHVKFYREDMQGACDSIQYNMQDSLLAMYYNPVIWSSEYQLSGDTIYFTILDSINTRLELIRSGFIVASLYDETEFNQVKGINITGNIRDKKLETVDVVGNAECFYYIQEEDSSLIGINHATTTRMQIVFENNEIQYITMYDQPEGNVYPDNMVSEEDRKLKDFRWLIQYRPKTIEDIFHTPIPRYKNSNKSEEEEIPEEILLPKEAEEQDVEPVLNKDH